MAEIFPFPPAPRVRWRDDETRKMASLATLAPRIPFANFMRNEFDWRIGEHVAMIGPTGQGKTTMLLHVLPRRKFTAVLGTKQRDKALLKLVNRHGYKRLQAWPMGMIPIDPTEMPRRIVWPELKGMSLRDRVTLQQRVFREALDKIFDEGGWTTALDEAWYISIMLRLDVEIKLYLLQGREMGISLVCASQRPAHIPLEIYDQSTHLFFWRDNAEENLKRISGFSIHSGALIRNIVSNLEQFQVLYMNTRTGRMLRTRAPAPTNGG